MQMRNAMKKTQQGLSIIELMIAMTIGLLIMAGLANLFVQSRQSFRQDNLIARMQEDARFAMNQLSNDISMAGFFGPMVPNQIGNLGGVPAAAPFLNYGTPMLTLDNIAGTPAFDWTASLDDAVPGTDAVSVRRVKGNVTPVADIEANAFYLETNGQTGNMIPTADIPSGLTNAEYWEYEPSIWYIRSWCRNGDGIPSLVRRYWDTDSAAVVTDCMAAGVEDLQVELGLDMDGNLVPESYQSTPLTAANSTQVAFVRIHLLSRATNADQNYQNTRTYNIGNAAAYTPNDRFYRRVYTTTVQTRNPTGFRALTFQPPAN